MVPANNEEMRITNLALSIIVGDSKASSVIKIDIVNPIPAKNPTPIMLFQFNSIGFLQKPRNTAMNVNKKIPNGFPIINPELIPKL